MQQAEDLEDEETLHTLYVTFKNIIMLNDTTLFEVLFSGGCAAAVGACGAAVGGSGGQCSSCGGQRGSRRGKWSSSGDPWALGWGCVPCSLARWGGSMPLPTSVGSVAECRHAVQPAHAAAALLLLPCCSSCVASLCCCPAARCLLFQLQLTM